VQRLKKDGHTTQQKIEPNAFQHIHVYVLFLSHHLPDALLRHRFASLCRKDPDKLSSSAAAGRNENARDIIRVKNNR